MTTLEEWKASPAYQRGVAAAETQRLAAIEGIEEELAKLEATGEGDNGVGYRGTGATGNAHWSGSGKGNYLRWGLDNMRRAGGST